MNSLFWTSTRPKFFSSNRTELEVLKNCVLGNSNIFFMMIFWSVSFLKKDRYLGKINQNDGIGIKDSAAPSAKESFLFHLFYFLCAETRNFSLKTRRIIIYYLVFTVLPRSATASLIRHDGRYLQVDNPKNL